MDTLKNILRKSGWISILESVIFAIIGLVLVLKPEGTVKFCSYILGIIFICVGIYKIINYYLAKDNNDFYNNDVVYGIIAIIIGIVTMVYSNTLGSIFRVIIGIWIIYSALIRISSSIKLKSMGLKIWSYSFILAIIMLACGIFIISNSGAVIITIGISIIIYSVIDIIEDIIFMNNVKNILK